MNLAAEGWLMLLAAALYLFDAAVLLGHDEFVVVGARAGRRRVAFGSHRWRLGGREPWMPNPLLPGQPIFRLKWSLGDASAGPSPGDATMPVPDALQASDILDTRTTGVLAALAMLCLAALFVALPVALFAYRAHWYAAAVALAVYGSCGLSAVVLLRRRDRFGLTSSQARKIALECVLCPPFGVNLLRKACLAMPQSQRLPTAAALLGDPAHADDLRRAWLVRIEEWIDAEPEDSARAARLRAAAAQLRKALPA